ncbi:MAG TPA: response regulator [Anaerolineales bacterium]|jgi:DNA-binding response OmpR family regulator
MTKVLIAEDERDIRELISFTLRFHGFDVVTAKDGEEALELALKEHPHMVLLDIRMPRMSGYEVCRLIKDNEATKHIPVIFISAKGQESEVKEGMDAGAADYILKPFSPDQLIERVTALLP